MEEVLAAACSLADEVAGVVAVALVGSWARGAGGEGSDVDLVVLSAQPQLLLDETDWYLLFGTGVSLVGRRDFGLLQERRLRLAHGREVEVCVGPVEWATRQPVDAGTWRVVHDGLRALVDRGGVLAALLAAARQV